MDKGKRITLAVLVAVIWVAIGNAVIHAPVLVVYFVAVLIGVAVWLATTPRST